MVLLWRVSSRGKTSVRLLASSPRPNPDMWRCLKRGLGLLAQPSCSFLSVRPVQVSPVLRKIRWMKKTGDNCLSEARKAATTSAYWSMQLSVWIYVKNKGSQWQREHAGPKNVKVITGEAHANHSLLWKYNSAFYNAQHRICSL